MHFTLHHLTNMNTHIYTHENTFWDASTNMYSTLGGKIDKLDEAVNRELNVTRS